MTQKIVNHLTTVTKAQPKSLIHTVQSRKTTIATEFDTKHDRSFQKDNVLKI